MASRAGLVRRALPALLTAVVVGALGAYLYDHRAHLAESYTFRPGALLAIGCLVMAALALRGLANQLLFSRLGVAASYRDWVALVTVNAFSNYLPLSAGLVAKAFYLKRVHQMPYREFALGQVSLLLLVIATNGAVGLVTVALWRPEQAVWVALGFAAMIAAGGVLFLPARVTQRISRGWLRAEPGAMAAVRAGAIAVAGVQVGVLGVTAISLKIGFSMGHADVGLAACAVFSAATVLTRLVSITPGAIGVREFLIGGLAVLTGFELQDAVIAATVVRLAEMVVIGTLGGFFTYTLSDRIVSTYEDGSEAE